MTTHSLVVALLCFGGLILSGYIRGKRAKNEKLVCLIGEDCNKVVYSKYATIFGISNEVLGMLYYGLSGTFYILASLDILIRVPFIEVILPLAALGAAMFSWYLIFVQIAVIKEWCLWCITSSILSTLIFILVL